MKIFLAGYYGFKNFGDELLLYKILQDILNIIPEAQFFVWTGNKDFTEKFLRDFPLKTVNRFRMEDTISAIKSADIIVMGGGGLIQEHYGLKVEHLFTDFGKHVPSYAIPPLIGRILGKRVFYWGLGHGPVVTEEGINFSKWFYSLADVITVRDYYSHWELKKLLPEKEIYLDIDPLLDFDFNRFSREKINKTIGLNIRKWFNEDELVDKITEALQGIIEKEGIKVIPIPCDLSADRDIIDKVLSRLPAEAIISIDIKTIMEIISAISICDIFLGMRLHSLMAAYMLGKPLLAISYDPKTEEFMNSINGDYIKITDISSGELSLKLNKGLNSAPLDKMDFEYKTPLIFEEFIKKNYLKPKSLTNIEHDFQLKEKEYIKDFVKTLFFQRESLYKKLTDAEIKNRNLAEENDNLKQERDNLKQERDNLKQERDNLVTSLNEVYNSNLWKLGQKYYTLRDKTFLRHLYPLYRPLINKLFGKRGKSYKIIDSVEVRNKELVENFVKNSKKIVIMLSSLPFEVMYNQRPLNLAKQFSNKGFSVLFVSWQWSKDEIIPSSYEEVYSNILQIPIYDFLSFQKEFFFPSAEKLLYITFPIEEFVYLIREMRRKGFKITYDIMDDWDGFKEGGQAPWYDYKVEERIILEADFVIAVKSYLVDKFKHLRKDINIVGNGFDEDTLGKDAKFIAGRDIDEETFCIGYYGWLTEVRFNWDLLFDIANNFENVKIQLIGYALSENIRLNMLKYKNIEYLGKINPSELKKYVSKWNTGIIPFKDNAISKGADPLKVYEYIYFGLPTVVKGIDDISEYPLMIKIDSSKELEKIIEQFNTKNKIQDFRISQQDKIEFFLINSRWESRLDKILNITGGKHFWSENSLFI